MKKYFNCYFLLFAISVIIFGTSCKYEPTEVNYQDIDPPEKLNLNYYLTPNDSVVVVYIPTTFVLKIDSIGKKIIKRLVIFDNDTIKSYDYSSYSIQYTIDPENLEPRDYELKMILFMRSHTGSLMDTLGKEGYLAEYKWKISVRRFGNEIPVIISFTEENGRGKLIWKKFDAPGFRGYTILKDNNNRAEIININDTVLIDSNIIAGKHSYKVIANYTNINGYPDKRESAPFNVDYSFKAQMSQYNAGEFRITWDKPLFYNNVQSYSIIKKKESNKDTILAEITDPTKTSAIVDIGLYKSVSVSILVKGKGELFKYITFNQNINYPGTDTFPATYNSNIIHCYSPDNMLYYLDKNLKFTSYNLNNKTFENHSGIPTTNNTLYDVSPNNKHLVIYNSSVNPMFFKPPDFTNYITIDLKKHIKYTFVLSYSMSNDGILFILYKNTSSTYSYLAVIDPYSDNLIAQDSIDNTISGKASYDGVTYYALSNSGNKLYTYKLVGDRIIKTSTIDGVIGDVRVKYIPGTNKVVALRNSEIQTWDCLSGQQESSFATEAQYIADVDYTNNNILGATSKKLYIYSPNNGNLLKTINTDIYLLSFLNSTIISSGIFAKINY